MKISKTAIVEVIGNLKRRLVRFNKSKVFLNVKRFWVWILTGLTIFVGIIFLSGDSYKRTIINLIQRYNSLTDRKNQDLQQLDDIRIEELRKNKAIDSQYKEVIAGIRKDHKDKLKKITLAQEAEIKKLIKENEGNPEKMAEQVHEFFGLRIEKDTTP